MNINGIINSQIQSLRYRMANNPKTFYKQYVHDSDNISDVNRMVVQEVKRHNPKSILEFGCGSGKNIRLFDNGYLLTGIDISKKAIIKARKTIPDAIFIHGEENKLSYFNDNQFDVSFTCSVLNHMPDIKHVLTELDRITKHAIVIAESNNVIGKFWYKHEYEKLRFRKIAECDTEYNHYIIMERLKN